MGIKPLAGVRVLDLSRVMAGPLCGMALGDLGADVIKVEHPTRGDDTRDWGVRVGSRNTSYFNSANRNKRSICLDLQSEEGRALALELAAKSDVVIQNFKQGGAEKLGLGYEQIRSLNPRVVYCSISGYSVLSPESGRPGYDLVIQGESGIMAMNGEEGQGPLKFGVAAVDMFTGMHAAQAILATLYERVTTGQGRHVQMALYDNGLAITSYYGLAAQLAGQDPAKFGNSHPAIVPYGVYEAKDGPLVIAVGNNTQFQRFCEKVILRPDLATDPRFEKNTDRSRHRDILAPLLEDAIRQHPRAELITRMQEANIPCGEVHGLFEAFESTRTQEARMVHRYEDSEAGPQAIHAPPYVIDNERSPVHQNPPHLGQHTAEVLQELLDIDTETLQKLKARNII
nr:CaiB/BaiF CoA-transferase family protein [Pusillimonas sp. MFBS29]